MMPFIRYSRVLELCDPHRMPPQDLHTIKSIYSTKKIAQKLRSCFCLYRAPLWSLGTAWPLGINKFSLGDSWPLLGMILVTPSTAGQQGLSSSHPQVLAVDPCNLIVHISLGVSLEPPEHWLESFIFKKQVNLILWYMKGAEENSHIF